MEFVSSAMGAATSAMVTKPKTILDIIYTFLSGSSIGFYIGGGITEYFGFHGERIEDGIIFAIALFGSGAATVLLGEIKPIIEAIRERFIKKD